MKEPERRFVDSVMRQLVRICAVSIGCFKTWECVALCCVVFACVGVV